MRLALLIDVKAMDDQGLTIVRDLGFRSRHDTPNHLHAQMFVQGHKRQLGARALDDVALGDQAGFGMR